MSELKDLEELVGNLDHIEPLGIEPDFSSLGIEPAEVLGFKSEEELETALILLTKEVKQSNSILLKYESSRKEDLKNTTSVY